MYQYVAKNSNNMFIRFNKIYVTIDMLFEFRKLFNNVPTWEYAIQFWLTCQIRMLLKTFQS